jgi:hypothetical protein
LFRHLVPAGGDGRKPLFENYALRLQGGPTVIGQGAAHGGAVSADDLGHRIVLGLQSAFDGPNPAHGFLQLLLGLAVEFVDGQACLTQVMELAELVRHLGQRLLHRIPHRPLAIGNDPTDGHGQVGDRLAKQVGEIAVGAG